MERVCEPHEVAPIPAEDDLLGCVHCDLEVTAAELAADDDLRAIVRPAKQRAAE